MNSVLFHNETKQVIILSELTNVLQVTEKSNFSLAILIFLFIIVSSSKTQSIAELCRSNYYSTIVYLTRIRIGIKMLIKLHL